MLCGRISRAAELYDRTYTYVLVELESQTLRVAQVFCFSRIMNTIQQPIMIHSA